MDATAPPSGCSYERDGDVAYVTLKPALSDVKWDEIESIGNAIETRLEQDKPRKVVFDISPLSYMGSAMVALVVRWWKAVGKHGGKSVVVCNDENVLEVLRLAALDKHWTIVETREDAARKLDIRGGPVTASPSAAPAGGGAVEGSGPMLPLIVGGAALPVGIIGAVLYLIGVGEPKLTLGMALAGGLTALVAGVMAAIVCTGTRRTAGIAVAVFGALIAAFGGYKLGDAAGPTVEAGESEAVEEAVEEAADEAAGDVEAAADEVEDALRNDPDARPGLSASGAPKADVPEVADPDEDDEGMTAEPFLGDIPGATGSTGPAVREVPIDD